MKITYNSEVDIAYISLKSSDVTPTAESEKVAFSKQFEFGVIDYGADNEVVGIELFAFVKTTQLKDIVIPFEDISIPFKPPTQTE